jgi:hypothetical protein
LYNANFNNLWDRTTTDFLTESPSGIEIFGQVNENGESLSENEFSMTCVHSLLIRLFEYSNQKVETFITKGYPAVINVRIFVGE